MRRGTLCLDIIYNSNKVSIDTIADELTQLLKIVLSTDGTLDNCGEPKPTIGEFSPWPGDNGHAFAIFWDADRTLSETVFDTEHEAYDALHEAEDARAQAYVVEIIGCPTIEPDDGEDIEDDEDEEANVGGSDDSDRAVPGSDTALPGRIES